MKYEVIIGLEIHTELKTASKMFCSCLNFSSLDQVNTNVCPICLGHPGTLPKVNLEAIRMAIILGLALDGHINQTSKFDRKNYFYPDLPKGYQISQYDVPIVENAKLDLDKETVNIVRLHLEEDTAKLTHPKNTNYSLADFNRAGTPLIELVTAPVIKTAAAAKEFCQRFQQILRYLEISDADMEKGQMRCEANISLQTPGSFVISQNQVLAEGNQELNPKVEVKNINSFRSVEKAINYEIKRQTEQLDKGEIIIAETRGWSDSQNVTLSQRIKESAADYRYFPEPDIPPLKISDEMIAALHSQVVELPLAKRQRLMTEYKINLENAEILITDQNLAQWYEEVMSEIKILDHKNDLATLTANWISNELFKHYAINQFDKLKQEDKITPQNFAELMILLGNKKINTAAGQKILTHLKQHGGNPKSLIKELKITEPKKINNLDDIVKEVIETFPKQKTEYLAGKEALLQFFIGKVMAKTSGQAEAKEIEKVIKTLIKL